MRDGIAVSSSATSASATSSIHPPANGPQRFIGGADDGYVDAGSCAACHREIAATYSQTGMGRAFYRAWPPNMVEDFAKANTYRHAPSGDHYTMIRRGAQFYQRRHQIDAQGREINVFERQIHYVNTVAAILALATLQGQTPTEDQAIAAWGRMVQKLRSKDWVNPPIL